MISPGDKFVSLLVSLSGKTGIFSFIKMIFQIYPKFLSVKQTMFSLQGPNIIPISLKASASLIDLDLRMELPGL